jgi:amino acid permease
MTSKKGQGATEYLVLFAVVLIIAMVVIALLGFFPSIGTGAKQSAGESYWKSVRPIQITSAYVASNGDFDVAVQNAESNAIKITGISISSAYGTASNSNSATESITLGTGEASNITLSAWVPAPGRCTNSSSYEYYIGFAYTLGSNTYTFNGTKPITGRCA